MRISKFKIALLAILCAAIGFELWHSRTTPTPTAQVPSPAIQKIKPDFALLPAEEVSTFASLAGNPKPHIESWEPTVGEIEDLESNLSQISTLSEKFHDPNRRIDDPRQFFRQYLAIEQDGNRVIFVNALCRIDPPDSNEWRKHLIDTVDGGKCFWKVTYSPAKHMFSNLFVNGMG